MIDGLKTDLIVTTAILGFLLGFVGMITGIAYLGLVHNPIFFGLYFVLFFILIFIAVRSKRK